MPHSVLKPRSLHWMALALLVISVCINYADRGNLGVAAKSLERELHLGQDQLGTLLGAFSITYALSQLVAGKLMDKWNVNWLYATAFLLWSGATGATGLASGFWAILILRLVLGITESIAYPAYSKMICVSFPEDLRGTANGLIDAGSKVGPALGLMVGVEMISAFSWRGMFLIIGGASLIWLIPWCAIASKLPGKPVDDRHPDGWSASYREILSTRALWGTAIGLFGGNYAWFFLMNWLPYYFENDRHFTHARLAILGSLPFWAVAISSLIMGLFADWLIRGGRDAGRVRRLFVCCGLGGCGIFLLPAVIVKDEIASIVLLTLALVLLGVWSSNHWAFTQFLAGRETAAKWTGIQNCFGNFAGLLGPMISGFVLKATHSFFAAFAIACAMLVAAVLAYWNVIGEPVLVFTNPRFPVDRQMAYSKESSP